MQVEGGVMSHHSNHRVSSLHTKNERDGTSHDFSRATKVFKVKDVALLNNRCFSAYWGRQATLTGHIVANTHGFWIHLVPST